jgi:hypothetical protein
MMVKVRKTKYKIKSRICMGGKGVQGSKSTKLKF